MTEALQKKDGADVPMLPPHILLLHLIAGIVLDWLFPFHFGHEWGAVGLVLVSAAFAVLFWSGNLFKKAGTNIRPGEPTTVIVDTGPYRYSRNPIYAAFLFGFVGLALLADAPVMLLLSGSLYYTLKRKVIHPEEAYLEAKFGDEYLAYKARVRRWL